MKGEAASKLEASVEIETIGPVKPLQTNASTHQEIEMPFGKMKLELEFAS